MLSFADGERSEASLARRRALEHALFGLLPLLVAGLAFYYAFSGGYAAGDFRHTFLVAGWRALHGHDPYLWSRAQIAAQMSFPYPAVTVLLLEPFALLPASAASEVFLVLCLAAIIASLRLAGVRDWRIYGLSLLWSPVLIGWQTGNFTVPLVLGVAAIWRYRDRPLLAGLLTAVVISIKPIMFPIGLWLLATGRWRASAHALAAGAALNLCAWSILGWGELGRWLHLVSVQSQIMYRDGYGIIALLTQTGIGRTAGTVLDAVLSLAVAGLCVWLARRRQEQGALAVAVCLMLIASPKIDQHYFALILVPLAVTMPSLSWWWALPLVLWLCPATGAVAWQIGLWWLAAVTLTVQSVQSARRVVDSEMVVGLDHDREPTGAADSRPMPSPA